MEQFETLSLSLARALIAGGQARDLRREHRLSLAEVAAAIGTTPRMVALWETGQTRPRKGNALAYGKLLAELATLGTDDRASHA